MEPVPNLYPNVAPPPSYQESQIDGEGAAKYVAFTDQDPLIDQPTYASAGYDPNDHPTPIPQARCWQNERIIKTFAVFLLLAATALIVIGTLSLLNVSPHQALALSRGVSITVIAVGGLLIPFAIYLLSKSYWNDQNWVKREAKKAETLGYNPLIQKYGYDKSEQMFSKNHFTQKLLILAIDKNIPTTQLKQNFPDAVKRGYITDRFLTDQLRADFCNPDITFKEWFAWQNNDWKIFENKTLFSEDFMSRHVHNKVSAENSKMTVTQIVKEFGWEIFNYNVLKPEDYLDLFETEIERIGFSTLLQSFGKHNPWNMIGLLATKTALQTHVHAEIEREHLSFLEILDRFKWKSDQSPQARWAVFDQGIITGRDPIVREKYLEYCQQTPFTTLYAEYQSTLGNKYELVPPQYREDFNRLGEDIERAKTCYQKEINAHRSTCDLEEVQANDVRNNILNPYLWKKQSAERALNDAVSTHNTTLARIKADEMSARQRWEYQENNARDQFNLQQRAIEQQQMQLLQQQQRQVMMTASVLPQPQPFRPHQPMGPGPFVRPDPHGQQLHHRHPHHVHHSVASIAIPAAAVATILPSLVSMPHRLSYQERPFDNSPYITLRSNENNRHNQERPTLEMAARSAQDEYQKQLTIANVPYNEAIRSARVEQKAADLLSQQLRDAKFAKIDADFKKLFPALPPATNPHAAGKTLS